MTDENYYKTQADEMCTMLKRIRDCISPRTHESINAVREVTALVGAYESHERTSGRQAFRRFAQAVGADPDWYGATVEWPITINGKTIVSRYRISGINPTKPVNKIMLTSSRDKIRWTSIVQVAEQLGNAKAPEERKRAIQV